LLEKRENYDTKKRGRRGRGEERNGEG